MSSVGDILVVEDDHDIRETLTDVIEGHGYRVVAAEDGEAALGLLKGGVRPRLILLDLSMPRMSGRQFREAQRADAALADIPVIIFSASRAAAQDAVEVGASGHLSKPVELARLLETIALYCGPAAR